jgi:hypothetical protein
MITQPWMDPRSIDWTDSLNPLVNPGWSKNNNRFVYEALTGLFIMALRNARGIEPRVYVGPNPQNMLIPAGTTQDFEVPLESPNFWLYALTATPASELDFLFQITDAVSGATLFSQPVSAATFNTKTSGRGPQAFLSEPQLYDSPSYPIIRVINTAGSDQICRVTLFGCVEYDV